MSVSTARLFLLSAPLLLTACGEGWETKRTDKIYPYGNKRTAGSGVMYVRAQMMPEKELKLEPVKEVEAKEEEVKPVLKAEEIFEDANVKGAAAPQKSVQDHAPSEPEAKSVSEELIETAIQKAPAVEDEMEAVKPAEVHSEVAPRSADLEVPELSAEDYVANSPKRIEKPDIAIQDAVEEEHSEVVEHVTSASEKGVEKHKGYASELDHALEGASDHDSHGEESEVGTDELVAPKQDFINYEPQAGEISLDEIYSDPF